MVLITTGDARAETFDLETKRLPSSYTAVGSSEDAAFLSSSYQMFYTRNGSTVRMGGQSPFTKVVTKEPEYASASPFKGVAKLGSQEFGFAFDTAPAKSDRSCLLCAQHKAPGHLCLASANCLVRA